MSSSDISYEEENDKIYEDKRFLSDYLFQIKPYNNIRTEIQGPRGLKGPKGDLGFTGDVGPTGTQGISGLMGTKGDIGPTGPKGECDCNETMKDIRQTINDLIFRVGELEFKLRNPAL